jgi:hypothetical protein
MANPTTAFGWVMPTTTDLVTDLPADFAVFGQGVDTSMQYLLGGTTGQVLSKTSATNMAFTWVTAQVGDITGVTAGTGITGGGTSGTVTVTNDMATAITTSGDLVQGTGSGTYARLGTGTNGQFLTTNGTTNSWGTPAAGSMTLLSTTAITNVASISITGISQSYKQLIVRINNAATVSTNVNIKMQLNTVTTAVYSYASISDATSASSGGNTFTTIASAMTGTANTNNISANIVFTDYTATTGLQLGTFDVSYIRYYSPAVTDPSMNFGAVATKIGAISSIQLFPSSGNWTAQGNIYIYGVN